MSQVEKSAVKSLLSMHRNYAELDEYLEGQLKEAGYAGVDVQRNPGRDQDNRLRDEAWPRDREAGHGDQGADR